MFAFRLIALFLLGASICRSSCRFQKKAISIIVNPYLTSQASIEFMPKLSALQLLLVCLYLNSCAAVTVRQVSIKENLELYRQDVLTSGQVSELSRQYLQTHFINPDGQTAPVDLIKILEHPGPASETPERISTLAETALAQALSLDSQEPQAAADWYLYAAAAAYDALFPPECRVYSRFDPRHERLRLFYARSVAGWIANQKKLGLLGSGEHTVLDKTYSLVLKSGPALVDPNAYSELFLAPQMNFEGLTSRSMRRGIGAPFIGWRENKLETVQDRYFPRVGFAQALSAVILFSPPDGGVRKAELSLYDSLVQESVNINGEELPLQADFTAAFGYQISKSKLKSVNVAHTLDIEAGLEGVGFYMLEPYRPNKIPLITAHGLLSSPLTWIDVNNALLNDPEIRRNFQVWHFYYPPGLPIIISAGMFRDKIEELFRTFDPAGTNVAMDNAVVLAHSMGGLITRTAVADSHDTFWLRLFGKTEKELSLPPDLQSQLEQLLTFKRKEFIKRVVFIAVPHRGSPMSESLIGWIGRSLISVPARLVSRLRQLHERLSSFLLPEAQEALGSGDEFNSIRGLSPYSLAVQAISKLAIARGVKFHSIIGTEAKTESGEPSDGIVPYSSAHLEGAVSELTVPTGHSAHTHPLAIQEIERILRLHLQEYREKYPAPAPKAPAKSNCPPLCAAMH